MSSASVSFTPPNDDGGSTIIGYTVTSNPGSITATGESSPIVVSGLTDGTPYTFTVRATNSIGSSAESTPSNSFTPTSNIDLYWSSVEFLQNGTVDQTGKHTIPATTTSTGPFAGTTSLVFSGGVGIFVDKAAIAYPPDQDFTLEFWIKPTAGINYYMIGWGNSTYMALSGTTMNWVNGGPLYAPGLTQDTWSHVAISRSGTLTKSFVNGVLRDTATSVSYGLGGAYAGANALNIGNTYQPDGWGGHFEISQIRSTNGVARYTSNFTAPTAAFPTTGPTDPYFANVTLLLRSNGEPGSSTFTDSSSSHKTVTAGAGTTVSMASTKFGPSSGLYTNSNTAYLTVPASADLNFGSNDFTIEAWIKINDVSGYKGIFGQHGMNPSAVYIRTNNSQLEVLSSTGSGWNIVLTPVSGLVANTWQHIAVTRASGIFYVFIDGVLKTTYSSNTAAIISSSDVLYIGNEQSKTIPFVGYIDEFRVTNGVARYTASFTPPATQFPTS